MWPHLVVVAQEYAQLIGRVAGTGANAAQCQQIPDATALLGEVHLIDELGSQLRRTGLDDHFAPASP